MYSKKPSKSRPRRRIAQTRNLCVLARVDHGKTSLTDSLIASNSIGSTLNPVGTAGFFNSGSRPTQVLVCRRSALVREARLSRTNIAGRDVQATSVWRQCVSLSDRRVYHVDNASVGLFERLGVAHARPTAPESLEIENPISCGNTASDVVQREDSGGH